MKRIPVQGILSICLVSNSALAGRLVRLVICSWKNRMCCKIWKVWTTCVMYQLHFLRMGQYAIGSKRYHFILFSYRIYYEEMKQRQETSGVELYTAAEFQPVSLKKPFLSCYISNKGFANDYLNTRFYKTWNPPSLQSSGLRWPVVMFAPLSPPQGSDPVHRGALRWFDITAGAVLFQLGWSGGLRQLLVFIFCTYKLKGRFLYSLHICAAWWGNGKSFLFHIRDSAWKWSAHGAPGQEEGVKGQREALSWIFLWRCWLPWS